jgi:hypothetical protein
MHEAPLKMEFLVNLQREQVFEKGLFFPPQSGQTLRDGLPETVPPLVRMTLRRTFWF